MSGALDWLAVGDVAEERGRDNSAILGGGAARLAAHAAALRARVSLVAKMGEDDAGRRVRDALERLKVDLRWLRSAPAMRTNRSDVESSAVLTSRCGSMKSPHCPSRPPSRSFPAIAFRLSPLARLRSAH